MAGTRKRRGASPPAAGETGVRARIFKWIAGITAVISLVIGVHQLVTLGGASRQRRRQVAELLSTESVQRSSGDFAGAWTSLDKAIQIDNSNSQARREQEDLAMAWLDADRPIGENQKFSDLVEKVAPAVSRAAASEDRSRKADAFAHLGWADFLRSRDGVGGLKPEDSYRKALEEDPNNVYANAMLGHLTLWKGRKLDDARRYFATALATGRVREFVRRLQLSALFNYHEEELENEAVRVANEMRKGSEKLNERARSNLFSVYYDRIAAPRPKPDFLAVVPPAEHLATVQWLFADASLGDDKKLQREYWLAILEEASGHPAEALQRFRLLRSKLPRGASRMSESVDAAIQRLARGA